MMMMMSPSSSPSSLSTAPALCLTALLILVALPTGVNAILPTGSIDVSSPTTGQSYTLLASQASFGSYPAMARAGRGGGSSSSSSNPLMELILPPQDDPLLCAETEGKANYTTTPSSWSSSFGNRRFLGTSGAATADGRKRRKQHGRSLLFGGRKSTTSLTGSNPNTVMLVPRGSCTFERKALSAQRLGATAILVYGTLDSRYALNKTTTTTADDDHNHNHDQNDDDDGRTYTIDDVLWPQKYYDYDCSRGRAEVPTSLLSFDPLPYNGRYNDDKLTGSAVDGNLCAVHSTTTPSGGSSFADLCPSQRCLLTGEKTTSSGGGSGSGGGGGTRMEACCAWDLHVWLYSDPSIPEWYEPVTIPAFYVTMEEGAALLRTLKESESSGGSTGGGGGSSTVGITMSARWAPTYNPSALLIWALGVTVCFVAAYLSASEYRSLRFEAKRRLFEMTVGGGFDAVGGGGSIAAAQVPPGNADPAEVPLRDESSPVELIIPSASHDGIGGKGSGSGGGSGRDGTPRSRSRSRSPPSDRQVEGEGHYAPSHRVASSAVDAVSIDADSTAAAAATNVATAQQYQHQESQQRSSFNSQDESLELSASHALGFVVMASCSLTVLFVFKIYNIVKIMYAFGCSGAMTQVLFFPLWDRIGNKLGARRKLHRTAFHAGQEFGPVTYLDLLAGISGYGLGLAWLITAFYFVHPEEKVFFWLVQDIMGSCMCILFLSIIKLNSIRVASILLIIAFFYDIFFVFVTPLLTKGGKSIMITVATSGGPPKADPSWCEKYPRDNDCKGGDPLPMLLTVPRLFDYQGGSSLLGLGDIVLPGLLLSFAARFDEAKKLVRLVQTGNTAEIYPRSYNCLTVCCRSLCSGGYLIPVTVAYAVGLCMANVAVYLMQMGQPALLYLVPCCLGTITFLGWRNHELGELWEGPKAIKTADAMMYGEYAVEEDADYVGSGDAEDGGLAPTIAQLPPEEDIYEKPAEVISNGSNNTTATGGDVPLLNQRKRSGGTMT
mmetsp:Transcript_31189/g.68468  ORF Transcript_31189/g.68468 Transcript_31189/m.68468 type:complete len:1004 (-) Transcript_31189:186-3197(-)